MSYTYMKIRFYKGKDVLKRKVIDIEILFLRKSGRRRDYQKPSIYNIGILKMSEQSFINDLIFCMTLSIHSIVLRTLFMHL